MAEFLEKLALAALGAVFGALAMWRVSHKQTRRSDLRNRVSLIEANMRSLEAKAMEYWLVEHGNDKATSLEKEIKGFKKSVGMELTMLRNNNFKVSRACDTRLVAINKAATSMPFETRPHQPEPARVEQIQNTVNEFISELRRSLSII